MSDQSTPRSWQSVRTILEGLILAGVLWLANSTQQQATATVELRTQMQGMSDEIRSLRAQLADVPAISRDMARLQVQLGEHERRIGRLEDGKQQAQAMKGWTR
jgi:hypothetical protein